MTEPFKASFLCEGCGKWFWDYVPGNCKKNVNGSYVDRCRKCQAKKSRRYRQDHPDQMTFDFDAPAK